MKGASRIPLPPKGDRGMRIFLWTETAVRVCSLMAEKTRYVQPVFSAIQAYIGIDKPEWLM